MSAVVAAVFQDHSVASHVRTALVGDGLPTDRVELTSREEPGQVRVEPAADFEGKLAQYFGQLFPGSQGARSVRALQQAVLAGYAVIAVHPRGEVETGRTVELLNRSDPLDLAAVDLDDQSLEYAAAKEDSTPWSWIGRVLVAPMVRDG